MKINKEIKNKNAMYIGHIGCKGTAMAVHTRNIAQLLEMIGYQVSFISQCVPRGGSKYDSNDRYIYNYTKQYVKIPKISAIEWIIEELFGIKLFNLFKKKVEKQKPELVVFYGYSGEKKIINYCKKHDIKVIIDRTDWFDADDKEGLFGKIHTKYLTDKCIEKYDLKANGVVSISEFFYNFYTSKGQKTIWIPPIFTDIDYKTNINKIERNNIKLVYAGSLGNNKDIIDPIVNCITNIFNKENIKFILNLVGITEEQLDSRFGNHDWKKHGIFAYGRVSHEESQKIVSQSDFSFLLRQNKRYAKAGFSTKFAESMSLGVPVICTKVGGADSIITDMLDGIHITDNNIETIENVLCSLLEFSDSEINKIKQNTYDTAHQKFLASNYSKKMNEFIQSI